MTVREEGLVEEDRGEWSRDVRSRDGDRDGYHGR